MKNALWVAVAASHTCATNRSLSQRAGRRSAPRSIELRSPGDPPFFTPNEHLKFEVYANASSYSNFDTHHHPIIRGMITARMQQSCGTALE